MITIYLSDGGRMLEQDQICPGAWIHLCDPSEKEIGRVCAQLHIDPDLVRAPLDEEERSRIEQEDDGQTLIIVDTPTVQTEGHSFVYSTIPFGIILTQDNVVTVCLRENALARAFMEGLVKGCSTKSSSAWRCRCSTATPVCSCFICARWTRPAPGWRTSCTSA